jgi:hypothetical protein
MLPRSEAAARIGCNVSNAYRTGRRAKKIVDNYIKVVLIALNM